MAELFFREDRDNDFYNACQSVINESKDMRATEIASKAIQMPAKSFYLHPREYATIIRNHGKKKPKNRAKQELHREIMRQYKEIRKERGRLNVQRIARIIAERPAPRFYISEPRAINLYYELLKQARNTK